MIAAAMHLHTLWSDGELTLRELRELLVRAEYRFGFMADHAPYFDADRARDYAAECAALSDDRFRFVPGLEFEAPDRMHIVGYGVVEPHPTDEPEVIIRHIQARGGLAVLAHPRPEHFTRIRLLRTAPDGIEVWNSKYDGRFAPRRETFELLRDVRAANPAVRAYYGLDFHWKRQFIDLRTEMNGQRDPGALLEALRAGDFIARHRMLELPSDGVVPEELLAVFRRRNRWHALVRRIARSANARLKRFGGTVPAPLKARARRWL